MVLCNGMCTWVGEKNWEGQSRQMSLVLVLRFNILWSQICNRCFDKEKDV